MIIVKILKEALTGSLSSMWNIILIVFPLMISIELLKDLKILDKLSDFIKPITKLIGTSKYSIIPLLSGLIFGIVYGAGIIIDSVSEGNMEKREVSLVMIFLAACHGVFEDTLIFVQIGANGWIILITRIVTALFITTAASRTRYFKEESKLNM